MGSSSSVENSRSSSSAVQLADLIKRSSIPVWVEDVGVHQQHRLGAVLDFWKRGFQTEHATLVKAMDCHISRTRKIHTRRKCREGFPRSGCEGRPATSTTSRTPASLNRKACHCSSVAPAEFERDFWPDPDCINRVPRTGARVDNGLHAWASASRATRSARPAHRLVFLSIEQQATDQHVRQFARTADYGVSNSKRRRQTEQVKEKKQRDLSCTRFRVRLGQKPQAPLGPTLMNASKASARLAIQRDPKQAGATSETSSESAIQTGQIKCHAENGNATLIITIEIENSLCRAGENFQLAMQARECAAAVAPSVPAAC